MIRFPCPDCGHEVVCPGSLAGKPIICRRCRSSLRAPSVESVIAARAGRLPAGRNPWMVAALISLGAIGIGVLIFLGATVRRGLSEGRAGPPDLSAGPASFGSLKISLVSASIGTVPLQGGGASDRQHILIRLRIDNTDRGRRFDYRSWDSWPHNASLTDEFGNRYRDDLGAFTHAEGHTSSARLEPGGAIEDVLVFELPVKAATRFTLSLPLDALGSKGDLVCSFPRSSVRESP